MQVYSVPVACRWQRDRIYLRRMQRDCQHGRRSHERNGLPDGGGGSMRQGHALSWPESKWTHGNLGVLLI